MSETLGTRLLGTDSAPVREPEDVTPESDYWAEYKLDLLEALESLPAWQRFTNKWRLWFDEPVLMTKEKLERWARAVKALRQFAMQPDDRELRKVLNPQVFASVNLLRLFSRRRPTDPIPPWGATFIILAEAGYFKRDDQGVYLDERMLADVEPSKRVVAEPLLLQWLREAD